MTNAGGDASENVSGAGSCEDRDMSSDAPRDPDARGTVTLILDRARSGDSGASEELLPIVYQELRRLAQWRMSREAPGHTLQATALVHEAYLRLVGGDGETTWENRRHFIGAAAEAMRRILIERARSKARLKRGGEYGRESASALDAIASPAGETDPADLLSLDQALTRLEAEDPEAALIAKLRHLSGYPVREIADALGVSERSVVRKWSLARAWLLRELESD